MENKKLSKDEIAEILNKHSFLGHHEWRFNYDDKVFSVYYADSYLDIYIARAIAKAYLRLEAKQAKPKGVKIQGIDQGEKFVVMNFDDNKCLTDKEMAEGLVSMIKAASTSGNGMSYHLSTIKCTAIQHIVHSGYPLIPETLICILDRNHKTQHCATDQKGNRINWS